MIRRVTNAKSATAAQTVFPIIFAVCFVHLLNDTVQAVIPSIYPILKVSLDLSYTQIGLIGFALSGTASVLQPIIGLYTDRRPMPYLLPIGVVFTLAGVISVAFASHFLMVMLAVILIGIGSAIFHPESSRVAFLAAGPRKGMAQSIFQFGGNAGQALAPIMTILIFAKVGQFGAIWFSFASIIAIVVQFFVGRWYAGYLHTTQLERKQHAKVVKANPLNRNATAFAIFILMLLLFSKNVYTAAISNYYSFYLMEHFHVSLQMAQIVLFVFLISNVIGLLIGGALTDRFGRRNIIWFSILGTAPFSLALPYANFTVSIILLVLVGLILSSAFSIIVVYAHELLPGKVGLVSGIFFGISFGLGGIGTAFLGNLADTAGIPYIMQLTSYLPLLGLLTVFLPTDQKLSQP